MAGSSLAEIERAFGTAEARLGKCAAAREFVLRIIPEFAYIFGLPAQIYRAMRTNQGVPDDSPVALRTLGACVREGFDDVVKLALRQVRRGAFRRVIHRDFPRVRDSLRAAALGENFNDLIARVRDANARAGI